jgi:hypothetical protein
MPVHSLAPKKMFFVYEIHAAPSAATDAPAAPSAPLAIFGCDCDCGVGSYTYLYCNESRWSKQTATVTFKCVTLLPPKEAHALSVCSSSWLSLLGVEECKHKLPLCWILPPEALSISSGSSVGPYASLTLLAGVVTKACAWSPFGPLMMRVLSQQPGCSDLPRWFVKTKHRQVAFVLDCKLQHFESQILPLLQKRSLLRAARLLGSFAHQPPRFKQVPDACSVLDGEVQRGTGRYVAASCRRMLTAPLASFCSRFVIAVIVQAVISVVDPICIAAHTSSVPKPPFLAISTPHSLRISIFSVSPPPCQQMCHLFAS